MAKLRTRSTSLSKSLHTRRVVQKPISAKRKSHRNEARSSPAPVKSRGTRKEITPKSDPVHLTSKRKTRSSMNRGSRGCSPVALNFIAVKKQKVKIEITPSPSSRQKGIRSDDLTPSPLSASLVVSFKLLPKGVFDLDNIYSRSFKYSSILASTRTQDVSSDIAFLEKYGSEFYGNLFESEKNVLSKPPSKSKTNMRTKRKSVPPKNAPIYMKKQVHLTVAMRSQLVDWLIELENGFKMSIGTVNLAVKLVDKTMEKIVVKRRELQLVGCACTRIACKLNEIHPPTTDEFAYISDNSYTREEIAQMELQICAALTFNFTTITAYQFRHRFLQASGVSCGLPYPCKNPYMEAMVDYLLEISLLQHELVDTCSSLVMASVVFLARATIGLKDGNGSNWGVTLIHYTSYRKEQLEESVKILRDAQESAGESKLKCVFEKYIHKKNLKIALKPSLRVEDLGF